MAKGLSTTVFLVLSYLTRDCYGFHVELRVPRYVHVGGTATLKCDYNVEREMLHKVDWYKQGKKIFQFVKGRQPPFRNYTIVGAQLDLSSCNEKQVVLKKLDFDASGLYSCEVTTDTPIYTKPSDDQELTVMQTQLEDPQITFRKPEYVVGELLEVNCTSGAAKPTPEVTWLLNGKQAEEQWMKTFPVQKPSSVTVQLSFEVKEEHISQLNLTCLATIPGFQGHHVRHSEYADHRMQNFAVTVVPAPPLAQSGCGASTVLSYLSLMSLFIMFCWVQ